MNKDRMNTTDESNMNTKDFLIGALVGGIIGATTALFLAPKSGKELRSNINDQAILLKDKTGQIRETAITKGGAIAAVAKEKTATISKVVSEQSTGLLNKVKRTKAKNDEDNFEDEYEGPAFTEVLDEDDIQKKLEETKKAFEETEKQINY